VGELRYRSTILDLSTRYSGQLHAPTALPPGKSSPATHWVGGLVGPRDTLGVVKYLTSNLKLTKVTAIAVKQQGDEPNFV
jgi:hypothetical protein